MTRTLDLTEPVEVCSSGLAWQDLNKKPYQAVILVVRRNCKAYVIPNDSCITLDPIGSPSEVYLFFTDHGGTWDNGGAVTIHFSQAGVPDAVVSGNGNVIEVGDEPIVSTELDLTTQWRATATGPAYYDLAEGQYENLLLVVDNDQMPYALPIDDPDGVVITSLGFSTQVHAFFVDALPITDNRGEVVLSIERDCLLSVPPTKELECRAEIPVLLTNAEAVRALSFGLSHDHEVMCLEGIRGGPVTLDVDLFIADIGPAPCPEGRQGGTVAIIVSLQPPLETFPPGSLQEIAKFVYKGRREGQSPLEFVDCLGDPSVEAVLDIGGLAIVPRTLGGVGRVEQICFIRGNANEDGGVNIADPVKILYNLFLGEELSCLDAADSNDDGLPNIADPIYLINYLFREGPPPGAPYPDCGADLTDDEVDCSSFPACCP